MRKEQRSLFDSRLQVGSAEIPGGRPAPHISQMAPGRRADHDGVRALPHAGDAGLPADVDGEVHEAALRLKALARAHSQLPELDADFGLAGVERYIREICFGGDRGHSALPVHPWSRRCARGQRQVKLDLAALDSSNWRTGKYTHRGARTCSLDSYKDMSLRTEKTVESPRLFPCSPPWGSIERKTRAVVQA